MSLAFLHTADWQLGKPFASVADEAKRHRLQQERIHAIERLAGPISESGAAFVLVAGDLFDSSQATKATVSAACQAIGSLKVPVIAIPGNHDHGGAGSVWDQEFFRRERDALAPNFQILLKPEPVVVASAILFPAPLLRRHEAGDPSAWIRTALDDPALPADLPRIVLAHGTVQGFGTAELDEDELPSTANLIDLSRLPAHSVDYIALGDWHGTKQVGPKAWYSGTPEIDRFPRGEGNRPGYILKVTVARGTLPQVEEWRSAKFEWRELGYRFTEDSGLDLLKGQLDELLGSRSGDHLLQLRLDGSLGIAAAGRLEELLETLDARLLRLKLYHSVTVAPSEEEAAALTRRAGDPLIVSVASQLAVEALGDDEEAAIARLALRELYGALT
ncbi:DNA repair exonuclease [Haloferula sp. BvORR071]|uniref:metallophosphoesterase family protein n=1 Tax=Haloferula sp. BvORR071 TaxID=1396141 RepID=UPI000558750F|nr:DNA repair exonuclease [Haloferula sp. BvORR071]